MDELTFDFEPVLNKYLEQKRKEVAERQKHKQQVNCTYWMRGRCMSGERCEFLHSCNPRTMPKCIYYSKGTCQDRTCMFKHEIDPLASKACPAFDAGYCKRGQLCRMQHLENDLCPYGTKLDCCVARSHAHAGYTEPRGTWPANQDSIRIWKDDTLARRSCSLGHVPILQSEMEANAFLSGDPINA